MKEKIIQLIKDRKELESLTEKVESLSRRYVKKAHDAYYTAEQEIYKEYGYDYATTCYDFVIGASEFDDFEIIDADKDCFKVQLKWTDRWAELFSWIIEIPYDETLLDKYVKKFKAILLSRTKTKVNTEKRKVNAKRKREYEKLKKEFEKTS